MERKTTIADELIAGLTELADALEAGDELGPEFTCRQLSLNLHPHTYTAEEVKAVRKLLNASQKLFAVFIGVSGKTVSQWEQGLGKPSMIACRFMDEIRSNPGHYRERLRSLMVPKRTDKKRV